MKLVDESTLIFMHGAYGHAGMGKVLQMLRERCVGVAQIAVVTRNTSKHREDCTWIFKSTNGKREVMSTYTEWLRGENTGYSWTANVTMSPNSGITVTM